MTSGDTMTGQAIREAWAGVATDADARPRGGTEWVVSPGLTDYGEAVGAMEERVALIRRGEASERVWLLEHPPLLTAGTSARDADLLDAGSLPVHRIGRGGQWTYHGPGQRVGYVMLDLSRDHGTVPARDVRCFVAGLEHVLIEAVASFGITANTRDGRVGLWVVDPRTDNERKIAAIGVRVTRGVTWHGFALNIAPDLRAYDRIVPCGITAHGVTSLEREGVGGAVSCADDAIRRAWSRVFGGVGPDV